MRLTQCQKTQAVSPVARLSSDKFWSDPRVKPCRPLPRPRPRKDLPRGRPRPRCCDEDLGLMVGGSKGRLFSFGATSDCTSGLPDAFGSPLRVMELSLTGVTGGTTAAGVGCVLQALLETTSMSF